MKTIIKYIDEALFSSASEFSKADTDDDFVDLGLSVKWAKCNLGAEEEYEYGNYYMWGSTKPNEKDECCWEGAPFNYGLGVFNEKQFRPIKNTICPNNVLAPNYDVAYKELGHNYRIPTKSQLEELMDNTNRQWIRNYENTRINGLKFINKNDDDKYIFVPAGGSYSDDWNYKGKTDTADDIDDNISLWSSTLDSFFIHCAWAFKYNSNSYPFISVNYYGIYHGFNIRPVCIK